MSLPERDWRLFKSVHRVVLDRYCARVLDECAALTRSGNGSPHERYLELFRLVKERDESLASAFNDQRRSTAAQRLAAMISLGVVTDAELSEFSRSTRESAIALADLWKPSGTRQRAGR
jgi:hypothetical protein